MGNQERCVEWGDSYCRHAHPCHGWAPAHHEPIAVSQEANDLTVKLTEWLISYDFFDEDGDPTHQHLVEAFGAMADQAFQRAMTQAAAAKDMRERECGECGATVVFGDNGAWCRCKFIPWVPALPASGVAAEGKGLR